jgi:hypothetical protein
MTTQKSYAELVASGVVCGTCADEGETTCSCYEMLEVKIEVEFGRPHVVLGSRWFETAEEAEKFVAEYESRPGYWALIRW